MTEKRLAPPAECAMCHSKGDAQYRLPLILQQKINDGDWFDATWQQLTKRWQIDSRATIMRWLCRQCRQSNAGYYVPGHINYARYSAPKRGPKRRKK